MAALSLPSPVPNGVKTVPDTWNQARCSIEPLELQREGNCSTQAACVTLGSPSRRTADGHDRCEQRPGCARQPLGWEVSAISTGSEGTLVGWNCPLFPTIFSDSSPIPSSPSLP